MLKNQSKKIVLMIIIIIACAIGVRTMKSGETLSEYAEKNPDKAYGHLIDSSSDNKQ